MTTPKLFLALALAASAQSAGPPIATVQAIALDPVHPGTVYAGVYSGATSGGVFKSTDGGASWTLLNADTGIITDVRALVVDPLSPSTVYAGTTYVGILKSTDGGATWNSMNSGLGALPSVESLAIDPVTTSTLYTTVIGGIFKSTDGGASWSAANSGLTSVDVLGVVVDPTTPATLYALLNGGGVYKSTNGAANWVAMNTGLTSLYAYTLIVNPAAPATLYVATYGGGVFKSSDGGNTWASVNSGLTDLHMGTAMAIDPANPDTVYAATSGSIFKTVNGGASWVAANVGLEASSQFNGGAFYTLVDSTNSALYLGSSLGGVYKSVDGAATWQAMDNQLSTNPVVLGLAIARANPADVYAGVLWGAGFLLGGIFESPNGGAGWNALHLAVNNLQTLAIDPSNPATVYGAPVVNMVGALSGGGVMKSTDGGATWNAANTGLPTISGLANGSTTSTFTGVNSFAIDPSNSQTVYAAPGSAIYKSIDGGGSWLSASSGVPKTSNILALAVDPSNSAIVYAGASSGALLKSTNGGSAWTAVSSNLPPVGIAALAVSPISSSTLFAGTQGDGVFISHDGGMTWTPANSGITNLTVLSLAINPAVAATIYAGTNGGGVFQSIDGGATWQATGNNAGNGVAPAASIAKVSGDNQTGMPGQVLPIPIVVVITNAANIPVAGVTVTFQNLGAGSLSATSVVSDAQGVASTGLTLGATPGPNTVTAIVSGLNQVVFSATGVVSVTGLSVTGIANSASFTPALAPGMLMSVFGTGLSSGSAQTVSSTPLAVTSASGTSVAINGIAAPLLYVSATQINLQIPYEVTPGSSALVVTSGGQSVSAILTVQAAGPGIFVDSRNGYMLPTESAAAGSAVAFYVTGVGPVTPAENTGNVPAPGAIPVPSLPVTVTVGGVTVTPVYIGIPNWSVGVLQINIVVPASMPAGVQPVIVSVGGAASNAALLTVVN